MPAISSSRAVQKAEAKYNVTTEYPNYGLHSAAASGNIGLVSFALTNGQPTNAVLDGVLPLHAAASGGNTRVVSMLIDAGADINAGRLSRKLGAGGGKSGAGAGASGSTMNICSTSGGTHIGTGGSTALHFAAANGHVDVLTLLLRCGADYEKPDKHGVTPLMLAENLGQTAAAVTLRDWAAANPSSNQPTSPSTPSIAPTSRSLKVKRSLETLFRRPWGGSRLDLTRLDHSVSRVDLTTGGESRGELGSCSSGVDLGAGESQSELGELGYIPPLAGGPPNNDSRRPSLPTLSGPLPGSKSQRPRSAGTNWSGGKDRVRRLFGRSKKDDLGWDAAEHVEVDWAEEVEFRRGERVAVEMGLKVPSAKLLARNTNPSVVTKKGAVRPRRKASEFHPDPEFDFADDEPADGRTVVRDDDGDIEDYRDEPIPVKRVLHPRSSSHCSPTRPGFSTAGMTRLTSPSMPSLPLPANMPSMMSSAATSTTSVPSVASPTRSHAPSPGGHTHMRSTSGSSITRRGLRASSSFSSFLPRQPEEIMPSSGESTVAGSAPVASDPAPQPQGQDIQQNTQDSSLLQPPDSRFRGDSLSSMSSENTNQLSSSMATTDTSITTPSLYAATSPLPPHKGPMTFSPVFEADDLDELDEVLGGLDEKRRSITPLNLRSVSTFEQAQDLVRQAEREILEPGPQGPDSPSLAEQLAAYGESLAIERRFARGEAQRRAWEAERTSREGRGEEEDEEEDGYEYDNAGPRIGLPLGRTASVDYHAGGRFRHVRTPSRTQTAPVRHTVTPLSNALLPSLAATQTRTPERPSFSTTSTSSQQRLTSSLRAIPRRTASDRSSYISRPSSIEIIETAATPIESPPSRGFELHRRSASTGVSNFPWSNSNFGTTNISQSPDQSDGDSHYELNSRTAPLSRITTAPSKIGNAIGSALSRDPNYEPHRRKKLKRFVKQLAGATVG